jgi:ThiF family protein
MDINSSIIQRRWPNAEAFYAERDHRTQLEVKNLHAYVHSPIEIHVGSDVAGDITIQRMALLAVNLTARWARNIRVVVPNVRLSPPLRLHGDEYLSARLRREMREADPFGTFSIQEESLSNSTSLRLFVGAGSQRNQLSESDYVIDAGGWSAIGYRGHSSALNCKRLAASAPAAALAAAIGAADLFKRAISHSRARWMGSIQWCTWYHTLHNAATCRAWHPEIPNVADYGNMLIAGFGAVGSALLYILSLMPNHGRVTVLDRDAVDTSNLNRSPLFTAAHAASGLHKTEVAQEILQSLGIEANVVQGTWRENGAPLSQEQFDVWISLTNEDGAWAEVPFQLPPVVLHGTTTSGWSIGFGRHIPRIEDCTACRLPRPHVEFRGPCSEGEVTPQNQVAPVRASLPFLSAASAALVAAELLKLNFPGVISLPNSVSADFRDGLQALIAVSFGPTERCGGCQMARLPLWNERGGRGRYAGLSLSRSDEEARVA